MLHSNFTVSNEAGIQTLEHRPSQKNECKTGYHWGTKWTRIRSVLPWTLAVSLPEIISLISIWKKTLWASGDIQ